MNSEEIELFLKYYKIDDDKKSWLVQNIKWYLNNDYSILQPTGYHPVDQRKMKLENIKSMVYLASLLNTNSVKIVNVETPCFIYSKNNVNLGPESKTYSIETYKTSCHYNIHQYLKRVEHGPIVEVYNICTKDTLTDILVKEMAQIINKKLFNAKLFFIMQLGLLRENILIDYNHELIEFETRVHFDY